MNKNPWEWIDCKEELPKHGQYTEFLNMNTKKIYWGYFYENIKHFKRIDKNEYVPISEATHWKPYGEPEITKFEEP